MNAKIRENIILDILVTMFLRERNVLKSVGDFGTIDSSLLWRGTEQVVEVAFVDSKRSPHRT